MAILALAAIAVRHGLVADDALRLWAGASTAADGEVPIGRIVAAYPTLPFLTTTLVAWLAPAGTPAPALVAAALLALIAGLLLSRRFARPDCRPSPPAVATLLVAFHPALLRAVVAGPADMFLAAFLLMLCLALYDLRARSGTSEVMEVGLALMGACLLAPDGRRVRFRRRAVPGLRGPSGAGRKLGAECRHRADLSDVLRDRRLQLCVLDFSRRRLDLLRRAGGEPVDCGPRLSARAVRRRALRLSGARREPGDGGGARRSARPSPW